MLNRGVEWELLESRKRERERENRRMRIRVFPRVEELWQAGAAKEMEEFCFDDFFIRRNTRRRTVSCCAIDDYDDGDGDGDGDDVGDDDFLVPFIKLSSLESKILHLLLILFRKGGRRANIGLSEEAKKSFVSFPRSIVFFVFLFRSSKYSKNVASKQTRFFALARDTYLRTSSFF